MDFIEVIIGRRTIRLFQQKEVCDTDLTIMLEGARRASCAANLQRLRYVVARTQPLVNRILEKTAWAKLVQPHRTPQPGVSGPAAFIAVTAPKPVPEILHADAGAAIQSMELVAYAMGLGCCWMGAIDREAIAELLELPDTMTILYIVAVGWPAEAPIAEDAHGSVDYYLDSDNRLHVPKLEVADMTVWK